MSSSQDINHIPVEDLTPEEASRIIHSHRKVRYGKCSGPYLEAPSVQVRPLARERRAGEGLLVGRAASREHPQLCSYKPNRSNTGKAGSIDAGSAHGAKRPHSPDGSDDYDHGNDHQPQGWPRAIDQSETMEIPRYIGQNSIPAILRDQPSPIDTKNGIDIRRDMRPIWGMDNSAPFPLMSAHHLDKMTQEISAELPSDREVLKLFKSYKEVPHPFWGFVIDIDDLESRLMIYLEERARSLREAGPSAQPISASWLAILFAVLAVGSQYHDSPYHVRTRNSQRYIQICFHFLRLGNFLLRPNLDSIQALLMTSFVLLNDMKAEGSWALLALTCRLAQSLGLHRAPPQENPSSEMSVKDYIISEKLNPDDIATATYDTIMANCEQVMSLRQRVYPQLRNKEALKTVVDRLQHYALLLHTAFVVSVCCRPALRSDCKILTSSDKKMLAAKCKTNLIETVKMFLSMHNISVIPTRSWAFTYHGLSSAVLLGLLSEPKTEPEVRRLQGDLISALSAAAAKERSSPPPGHITVSDKDIELSGPLSRALTALKHIYDYGSLLGLSGLKSEVPSGARTPVATMQTTPIANLQQQRAHTAMDPHQDAALAMTELQNGATLPDFPINMQYQPAIQQSMPVQGVTDMAQIDPATYVSNMSPMDLYDSIFWESPDPFYTGTDMNFDFMSQQQQQQQPPPGSGGQHYFY
ncbi:fungal specific transcription factor domain-containing protein [Seiridium cupressi]